MNFMLLINTLLIIVIIHLILVNINNAKNILNIELMSNKDDIKMNTMKKKLPNNINDSPIDIKPNKSIKGNVHIDPRDIPRIVHNNDSSNVKGNNINVLTNNSLEYGRLSDINKKLTPPEIKKDFVQDYKTNSMNIKPFISKNNCNLGSVNDKDGLGENENLLECYNSELSEYYNISDFKKNDRIYKELNKKSNNNKNIVVYRDLLQQNKSCTYNTSGDIHLLDSNQFDKYLQDKKNKSIESNKKIPCASNNNSNLEFCKSSGLDINEKPMNGGKINNYMGFNTCYNEYASYKSI